MADDPANEKTSLPQKLFEFLEFVTNRKKPKVEMSRNSEEDLVHKLSLIESSSTSLGGNQEEYLLIKNELRKAINQKTQATWEEQRVQVLDWR